MPLSKYSREDFYQYSIPILSGRYTLDKLAVNVRLIMVGNAILVLCFNTLLRNISVYNNYSVKLLGYILLFFSVIPILITFIKKSRFKEFYVAFLLGASSFLLGILMILVITFKLIEEKIGDGQILNITQVNFMLLIMMTAVATVFILGGHNLVKKIRIGHARKNSKSTLFYEDGEIVYRGLIKKIIVLVLLTILLNYILRFFFDDFREMYYNVVIYSGALLVIYLAPRNFMIFYLKKRFPIDYLESYLD
ncbi:hypothetical protein [uncultured Vagococcus sp.]|uniref:hypothetical protein n=1 Tax=uncultured Vagococcus sp. TaxID=189676 RepID=UPI0028D24990|nr:hypothetical protein [uncultured Vagococcus sp.]